MTLTPRRRAELAALLDDERRLAAEYPKVREYLDIAPTLAGTGDAGADAAFDLRFVHHVTGGRAESQNPYWDIVEPSVSEQDGRRLVTGGARLAYAQMLLQSIYAYAIPSPETLAWAADFCAGRRVLELGAGRGYWAAQLSSAGVDVTAYDSEPPDSTENSAFPHAGEQADVWHPVLDPRELDWTATGQDQVLFLCWPPGWGDTMASETLDRFTEAGGTHLIFVGQPPGGMTGDPAFFDTLSTHWHLETTDAHFVAWWNLLDVAQAWSR